MAKKQHYSARGAVVNFDELTRKNAEVVAVGNTKMNARGDRLGAGGKIIRKVEDVPKDKLPSGNTAYTKNPKKAIKVVSLKDNMSVGGQTDLLKLDPKDAKDPAELVKSLSKTKNEEEVSVEVDSEEKPSSKTTTTKRKIVDTED